MSEEEKPKQIIETFTALPHYVEDLKKLIENKFKIHIPDSWLDPIKLEQFCGYNDLREEQEAIWRKYLSTKKTKKKEV